jgi:hypothetical protein
MEPDEAVDRFPWKAARSELMAREVKDSYEGLLEEKCSLEFLH